MEYTYMGENFKEGTSMGNPTSPGSLWAHMCSLYVYKIRMHIHVVMYALVLHR